jgi:orotate phosphoribosyltransferase
MTAREELLQLIKDLAVVHGKVTLASGREADYYVDMRAVTLDGRSAPLVGRVMLETVADWDFDAVGGLTMGADPVALAMVHAAVGRLGHGGSCDCAQDDGSVCAQDDGRVCVQDDGRVCVQDGGRVCAQDDGRVCAQDDGRKRLDAFVVRKEAKSHGLQKRIEGPSVAGRRCLVVEDTSTTGGSPLSAVEAVREAGGSVVGVAVVVDRSAGAQEAIEDAGLPYRYAYSLSDLGL